MLPIKSLFQNFPFTFCWVSGGMVVWNFWRCWWSLWSDYTYNRRAWKICSTELQSTVIIHMLVRGFHFNFTFILKVKSLAGYFWCFFFVFTEVLLINNSPVSANVFHTVRFWWFQVTVLGFVLHDLVNSIICPDCSLTRKVK